jgi:cytochrome c5
MLAAAVAIAAAAQQAKPAHSSPKTSAGTANQTEHITLPSYPGEVLKGPNVEVYQKNCLICHSTRYVIMQPNFSRAVWEKEVKKMIEAYGATVPDAEQVQIVEYLVAVRGVPESKPAEAPAPSK